MFPIHFKIPGIGNTFYYYEGIYFAIAIICGLLVARKNIPKSGISSDDFQVLLLVALCGGILGGRVFHQVFYEHPFTFENFISIFKVWKGGISITGAVVIGPLLTYLYCRYKSYNFWKLFALVAPAIILAQGIGRMGCFMNGDAHGTKTESVFGVTFPKYGYHINEGEYFENDQKLSPAFEYSLEQGWIEQSAERSAKMHPAQLYEGIADFILFFILMAMLRKVMGSEGDYKTVPILYVGGYSFIRFWLEFVRADRLMNEGEWLSNMQIVLLIATVVCIGLVFTFWNKSKKNQPSA